MLKVLAKINLLAHNHRRCWPKTCAHPHENTHTHT